MIQMLQEFLYFNLACSVLGVEYVTFCELVKHQEVLQAFAVLGQDQCNYELKLLHLITRVLLENLVVDEFLLIANGPAKQVKIKLAIPFPDLSPITVLPVLNDLWIFEEHLNLLPQLLILLVQVLLMTKDG
jgi:hypothetical protein